jgi:hypothetical protein
MQRRQIRIARNDEIRPAVQRHFKRLIVLRVATFVDDLNDRHELGSTGQLAGEFLTLLAADGTIQFSPIENLSQFVHRGSGEEQDALV